MTSSKSPRSVNPDAFPRGALHGPKARRQADRLEAIELLACRKGHSCPAAPEGWPTGLEALAALPEGHSPWPEGAPTAKPGGSQAESAPKWPPLAMVGKWMQI